MSKYYRTKIVIEVISEDSSPSDGMELSEIDYAITQGDWSGSVSVGEPEELTPKDAAQCLLAQGSAPEFFGLDSEGKPLED